MVSQRARESAAAVLMVLLLVTAMPAAASSHNESTASKHTTDSDFAAAATLENVSVEGSGTSASVVLADTQQLLDGYEDGDIAEYGGDTGSFSVQTTTVNNGSYALEAPAGSTAGVSSTDYGTDSAPGTLRVSYRQSSRVFGGVYLFAQNETGDESIDAYLLQPATDDSTPRFRLGRMDSGSFTELASETSSVPTSEWTTIEATYDSGTLTVTAWDSAGNQVNKLTHDTSGDSTVYKSGGVGMHRNSGADQWVDDWRELTKHDSGRYISATHNASDLSRGWTDLTLTNATADVRWEADTDGDGSFETVANSTTVSSSANVTLDVSGTTADAWRANVSFARTDTNPTAELHDEGLLFQARDPSASNLSPDGSTVTDSDSVTLSADITDPDFGTAQGDSVDVEFTFNGSVVATNTVTSNGTTSTTVSGYEDGTYTWNVSMADSYGGTANSGDATVTLDRADPSLTNASPPDGDTVNQYEVNLSVDVSDGDFSDAGDSVTVTFYNRDDNTTIASKTVSSNQTVEVTWSDLNAGDNHWNVTASDDYGNADSVAERTISAPDKLTLREEHEPQTIVNDSTVTLRFYTVDGEIAIERTTSNGTISMEGLPTSEFVAFAESPDHYDRQIYVTSIFDQQEMFLLNQTVFPRSNDSAIESRFIYEDLTGDYPRSDTTVEIERSIDVDGDGKGEYMTVAGDYWGASNEFTAVLERGERYRVVLVNRKTGARNVPGAHIPITDGSQPIRVSGLVQQAANESGIVGIAEQANGTIDMVYRDPTDETTELTVTIESRSGTQTIYNQTVDGPLGTFSDSVALNDSQQEKNWVVVFDSNKHRSAIPVGSGTVGLPVAVPGWLLTLLMTMAVTFVGALYGPRTAVLGAWAMVFVAAGVAMFGWAFSGASVLVAALVAVGMTFLARSLP